MIIYSAPEQSKAKFSLGQLLITKAAEATLVPEDVGRALTRHQTGDWGEVGEDDRKENELSLAEGFRLLSVYHDANGVKFWIITERDRSVTTVLLPDDY